MISRTSTRARRGGVGARGSAASGGDDDDVDGDVDDARDDVVDDDASRVRVAIAVTDDADAASPTARAFASNARAITGASARNIPAWMRGVASHVDSRRRFGPLARPQSSRFNLTRDVHHELQRRRRHRCVHSPARARTASGSASAATRGSMAQRLPARSNVLGCARERRGMRAFDACTRASHRFAPY